MMNDSLAIITVPNHTEKASSSHSDCTADPKRSPQSPTGPEGP